jgi:hypothetical protein
MHRYAQSEGPGDRTDTPRDGPKEQAETHCLRPLRGCRSPWAGRRWGERGGEPVLQAPTASGGLACPLLDETSSARARTAGGIVSPRALAVLMLMTSSNFVGCSTGRSAGLAPFRILSTIAAMRPRDCPALGPYERSPPEFAKPLPLQPAGKRCVVVNSAICFFLVQSKLVRHYETTDARGGRRHQRPALLTFPTDNGVISQNLALAIR